ncbi:hypothetical protein [Serratia fonticola]|uniref:hypothetical protein n=1 Tax=Serratia fonticola TaxID=47917 RepID=UPI003BB54508
MKKIALFFSLSLALSGSSFAALQCGGFNLKAHKDGWVYVNGMRPESQKITFLGKKDDYENVKFEWRVATNQPGKWLGMEHIYRNGKGILNMQLLQASMDAPREFATYDCVKVK